MKTCSVAALLFCLYLFLNGTPNVPDMAHPPTAPPDGPAPLALRLDLVSNAAASGARMSLTLTNTGTETLPATGWTLFFNGRSLRPADASVVTVGRVNGDLLALRPGAACRAIPVGQSLTVTVLGGTIRNKTDFPQGFYLVFANQPDRAVAVGLTVNMGNVFAKAEQQLAARIFDQNATIRPVEADKLVKVFPTPVSYRETGSAFVLNRQTVIVAGPAFGREAALLASSLATVLGAKPTIQTQATGRAITLRQNPAIAPEGYELTVSQDGIVLSAASGAGIFYGISSLQTLLPAAALTQPSESVTVPGVAVTDAPRFGYRALLMDVARNFQPKSEVLKVLDVMGLYKLNTLHLHFSDDEGWRIEMLSLPELTAVGAKRGHSVGEKQAILPAYGSGPATDNPAGSGFYSKTDFVDILRYARDRHIAVIPEIESPGHARAALRAMDARYDHYMTAGNPVAANQYLLRDRADQSRYRSVQGWNDNVADVSLPSTYAFLERVVDDLRAMYTEAEAPLTTIHFGGDEVPSGVWQRSPSVQRLLATDPVLKTTDDLWYYYFGKADQMLKARGLFLSGWEEIGLKKVVQNGRSVWVPNPAFADKNFRVNVWKTTPGEGADNLAYRMANAGYPVIITGVTHLYLDLACTTSADEPGQYWGGYVDIDKPFYLIPYDYLRNLKDTNGQRIDPATIKNRAPLTATGRANIVGIEAVLFSETNHSPAQFEYKLLPKLLAVAERAWAKDPAWATEPDEAKSDALYAVAWSEFISKVGYRELPRLDVYAGGFAYRIPPPGVKLVAGKLVANVQFPGLATRYTADGSEPTASSPAYTEPLMPTKVVKFKTFNATGRASQTVTINP